jgi:hypothetical protein
MTTAGPAPASEKKIGLPATVTVRSVRLVVIMR